MSILAARWSAKPVSSRIDSTSVANGTSSGTICGRRGDAQGVRVSPRRTGRRGTPGAGRTDLLALGQPALPVGLEHLKHALCAKAGPDHLVAARKEHAAEAVKLLEPDRRRRVLWRDAHDRRLDVGRGAEIGLADLENVLDPREQLDVGRQARPELGPGRRAQPERELALEHEDARPRQRPRRQQLEHERGRNLPVGEGVSGLSAAAPGEGAGSAPGRACWRCTRQSTGALP